MQPNFWDADYNLGTALLGKGQVDEAIFYCDKAVRMQPNDPDAQVAFANALLQKKRIDDAIVHYQTAVAIRPDYFLARYGLGHALLEKGQLDAAIEHSRAALLIQPNNADCHTVLAIALDERGQSAEAIQHYEKALEISPQSVSALNNLAWLLAAGSNASLRNGARAIQFARQADQLSGGTNALVLRTLAAAYAEAGQFGKAIETAQAVSTLAFGFRLPRRSLLPAAALREARLAKAGISVRVHRAEFRTPLCSPLLLPEHLFRGHCQTRLRLRQ